MEHYITEIKIEELRHLSNVNIVLNKEKRTSLLLTGKNGSGKTTVLRAVKQYLQAISDGKLKQIKVQYPDLIKRELKKYENAGNDAEKYEAEKNIQNYTEWLRKYKQGIDIFFNNTVGIEEFYKEGKFITAFYGAGRKTGIVKIHGVENVELAESYSIESNPGEVLLKYLVHLKTQQSYARNEGDMDVVEMIDQWFERFTTALKVLLDNKNLKLTYDYKNYDFKIIEEGRKPFGFDQLSDGYSAAIQIVADLILRMEKNWLRKGVLSSYDIEGIVLIDELETHLHIGLQKTILPFLTEFFPNIQFIIATHSPYILNSIENCVIYDLENHIRMEDMSGYPAEGIVEGYFGIESYSDLLINKVNRYSKLVSRNDPTEEERAERAKIYAELKQLSGDLAKEAKDAFEEIEKRRKNNDKVHP